MMRQEDKGSAVEILALFETRYRVDCRRVL